MKEGREPNGADGWEGGAGLQDIRPVVRASIALQCPVVTGVESICSRDGHVECGFWTSRAKLPDVPGLPKPRDHPGEPLFQRCDRVSKLANRAAAVVGPASLVDPGDLVRQQARLASQGLRKEVFGVPGGGGHTERDVPAGRLLPRSILERPVELLAGPVVPAQDVAA